MEIAHFPKRRCAFYSEFSIGLSFSNLLTKEETYDCLAKYRESFENRTLAILQSYEEQPIVHNSIPIKALFIHSLKLIEAEVEWLNDLLAELNAN